MLYWKKMNRIAPETKQIGCNKSNLKLDQILNLVIFLPPKIFREPPSVSDQGLDFLCKCGHIVPPVVIVAHLDEGVGRCDDRVVGAPYQNVSVTLNKAG